MANKLFSTVHSLVDQAESLRIDGHLAQSRALLAQAQEQLTTLIQSEAAESERSGKDSEHSELRRGDRVHHAQHGMGQVASIDDQQQYERELIRVSVEFAHGTETVFESNLLAAVPA